MASRKLRVHIENTRRNAPLFQISPEEWEAACARHRSLAKRLDATLGWDADVLESVIGEVTMLIGVPAQRHALTARAAKLEWIHATSAGIDSLLPLDWLPEGIIFTNNREAHGAKAEEFMRMAYTLINSRMPEIIANQQTRKWEQLFSPSLAGKTALVIGLGDLGQAAARAAKQVGLKVIGVSRSGRKIRGIDAVHAISRLDALLPRADYVVVAAPLTSETRQLLDGRRLGLMKRGAGLVNIARAQLVDYDELKVKLERGELSGAVLDVVDPEPLPPESPLWDVPNLIITPHISCDDAERYSDITLDLWFGNLERFLKGKPLRNRVDPRRGY